MLLTLSRRPLARAVWWATASVAAAGLLAALVEHGWSTAPSSFRALAPMFSLSFEGNLPTWYASVLLFACGLALALAAMSAAGGDAPYPRRWALLAALFFYISFDEAAELHEHLGGLLDLHGVLYFSWVVPAAIVVAALGLAYLPFVRALPPRTRRRFIVAGALYVGGALLMELPLGWWTEQAGDDNLGYGLIDFVEESLELAGTTLFLTSLLGYLSGRGVALRLAEEPSA